VSASGGVMPSIEPPQFEPSAAPISPTGTPLRMVSRFVMFSAVLGSYASGPRDGRRGPVPIRHLSRKIPAVADSFATLRGLVPRGPIARRHLTPTRTLQPLSRSVIGARSAARSPNSSSTGLEPCLRARSCPVQPETCRIAPSRLVPRPTSTGGQTWRTGDSSACRDTSAAVATFGSQPEGGAG
jgi:hypothetical protein